jgi:hypothetical protein
MKKFILTIMALALVQNIVLSKEIPVKIKPVCKITTCNLNLKEGDTLDFVVADDVFINSKLYIKKGQAVSGVATSLKDNNYLIIPAKIYIENFRTTNVENHRVKLKGIIYKSGNDHHVFGEIFVFDLLRGGEVQITPEKDEFTIYVEENL